MASSDPRIDAIADALAALRTPRRGMPQSGEEHFGPPGGSGWHGHRGHHGHGPRSGREWFAGHRGPGPGGRRGGLALMRMLQTLFSAPSPLGVSEIADQIGVDQPRASRLVQQGVDRGLVQREADPDDARRTRVALTDAGRALADRFRGQQRDAVTTALKGFTDREREDLARLLRKLADAWPSEQC